MIDLSYTRARLLAEIDATDSAGEPLSSITDLRVATRDAHVRVCGHGRHDLFPLLKAALLERFEAVPRLQLMRDLLIPLRNSLGNAYKHGNGRDPAKAISVELLLARKGALIAVTDEGTGFDVALTFRRFQENENYFVNHGCGFRNLHEASSPVSYENGGRTVLLCFRPNLEKEQRRGEKSELLPFGLRTSHLSPHLDADWIQTCLPAELPEFSNGQARLESCRVYSTHGRACDDCGNRYLLRVAGPNGRPAETRVLTGRLHPSKAAAEADYDAATRLREAGISKRVLIPEPVARLAAEPRLVLYDFDSWMNLWEFLTFRSSLKSLRHRSERIGQTLAALHRSPIGLPGGETDPLGGGFQAIIARAEANLQRSPGGSDFVNRFLVCVRRIEQRAALRRQQTAAPIHGAFGWDCIHYGVDGRFYLYQFEMCRRSDPGLDLGGFAADLLCFTLANHDEATYRICIDALLNNYNVETEYPMDEDDLRLYTAFALCERLGRAKPGTNADTGQLLEALDAGLSHRDVATASGVSS